jgi:hypothetical protein
MKKCAIFFMISFMLCLPLSLKGSDSPGQTDESPTDTEEHKKVGFAVIPVAFYQPETKFGGGVVGLFSIRPDPLVKTGRPSTVSLLVIYTQLNQFNFHIQPEIYLKDESFLLKGEFNTKRFSYKFWGIGNESPDEAEEDFTPRTTVLKLSLQKEILPSENLYAGIQWDSGLGFRSGQLGKPDFRMGTHTELGHTRQYPLSHKRKSLGAVLPVQPEVSGQ